MFPQGSKIMLLSTTSNKTATFTVMESEIDGVYLVDTCSRVKDELGTADVFYKVEISKEKGRNVSEFELIWHPP